MKCFIAAEQEKIKWIGQPDTSEQRTAEFASGGGGPHPGHNQVRRCNDYMNFVTLSQKSFLKVIKIKMFFLEVDSIE
jgi:hypothetical protein